MAVGTSSTDTERVMKEPMGIALLASFVFWTVVATGCLLVSSCTTADVTVGSAHVSFSRFLTSTSFSITPDGTITYSSDPQAEAISALAGANAKLVKLVASGAGL